MARWGRYEPHSPWACFLCAPRFRRVWRRRLAIGLLLGLFGLGQWMLMTYLGDHLTTRFLRQRVVAEGDREGGVR